MKNMLMHAPALLVKVPFMGIWSCKNRVVYEKSRAPRPMKNDTQRFICQHNLLLHAFFSYTMPWEWAGGVRSRLHCQRALESLAYIILYQISTIYHLTWRWVTTTFEGKKCETYSFWLANQEKVIELGKIHQKRNGFLQTFSLQSWVNIR